MAIVRGDNGKKMQFRIFNTKPEDREKQEKQRLLTRRNNRTKGKVTLPTVRIQEGD